MKHWNSVQSCFHALFFHALYILVVILIYTKYISPLHLIKTFKNKTLNCSLSWLIPLLLTLLKSYYMLGACNRWDFSFCVLPVSHSRWKAGKAAHIKQAAQQGGRSRELPGSSRVFLGFPPPPPRLGPRRHVAAWGPPPVTSPRSQPSRWRKDALGCCAGGRRGCAMRHCR